MSKGQRLLHNIRPFNMIDNVINVHNVPKITQQHNV